jgi:hypothetical protein
VLLVISAKIAGVFKNQKLDRKKRLGLAFIIEFND